MSRAQSAMPFFQGFTKGMRGNRRRDGDRMHRGARHGVNRDQSFLGVIRIEGRLTKVRLTNRRPIG